MAREARARAAKDRANAKGKIETGEVTGWFEKFGPTWAVDPDAIAGLADFLEICRTNPANLPMHSDGSPDPFAMNEARAAVIALEKNLPKLIAWAEQHLTRIQVADRNDFIHQGLRRLTVFNSLLTAAHEARPLIDWSNRPTRDAQWHSTAFFIERWIRLAWRRSGQKLEVYSVTSPMVKLIEVALDRVGETQTAATILKAFKRRRDNGSK